MPSTEPLLRPIRRLMPDLGGIDISPVILIHLLLVFTGCDPSRAGEADRLTPMPTAPARSVASRQRTAADGLRIRVHASPKSSRDGVEGDQETADGAALKVRVRAVAEDGEANRAVAAVVAAWLGIPKSHVPR